MHAQHTDIANQSHDVNLDAITVLVSSLLLEFTFLFLEYHTANEERRGHRR